MKVILYQDVKHLGEMGDVKNVANGYARNFLLPRMLAVPYNKETIAYFDGKKDEIVARKEQKRKDSVSLKEKLESLVVEFAMPAGSNGKLYGAVTSLTISEFLNKNGFEIERKKIEIPGVSIKNVGNYHCIVHLYESQSAEVKIVVKAQEDENSEKKPGKSKAKTSKHEKVQSEESLKEKSSENQTENTQDFQTKGEEN